MLRRAFRLGGALWTPLNSLGVATGLVVIYATGLLVAR